MKRIKNADSCVVRLKLPSHRCKNCDAPFHPKTDWQEFCCSPCRKEFWRHGGISIRRFLPTVQKEMIEPLEQRVVDLEVRLKVLESRSHVH
jgi:hypothetical protein